MDQSAGLSFYGSQAAQPQAPSPAPAPPAPQPLGGTPPAPPTPQASAPSSPAPAPLNPQAGQLQNQGRGTDTQLVHMTPDEVNSLRGLAQRFGGDLTTNPQTGLPEAGWLGKLLPTLLGVGASFIPGVGPLMAAGLVGAGQTALTGDLGKGLTAGLQAFGGASLGGALGAGGAASGAAQAAAPAMTGTPAALEPLASASIAPATTGAGMTPELMSQLTPATQAGLGGLANTSQALPAAMQPLANASIGAGVPPVDIASITQPNVQQGGLGGFLDKFKTASRDLPGSGPGMNAAKLPGKIAPWAAGAGLLSTLSDVTTPDGKKAKKESDDYVQMKAAPRKSVFDDMYAGGKGFTPEGSGVQGIGGTPTVGAPGAPPPVISRSPLDTRERQYFDEVNPNPRVVPFNATAGKAEEDKKKKKKKFLGLFNDGGTVHMETGGHVIPAFDVATYGNGSTKAGQAALKKLGGKPINGKGDGVSDSIKAKIDGKQEARLADGEVYFPPKAVAKLGGNKKLYAMMKAAETARKRTPSGSKVRGLA